MGLRPSATSALDAPHSRPTTLRDRPSPRGSHDTLAPSGPVIRPRYGKHSEAILALRSAQT